MGSLKQRDHEHILCVHFIAFVLLQYPTRHERGGQASAASRSCLWRFCASTNTFAAAATQVCGALERRLLDQSPDQCPYQLCRVDASKENGAPLADHGTNHKER